MGRNKDDSVNSLYNDCYIISCKIRRLDKTDEFYKRDKYFLMEDLKKKSESLFNLMANYLNGRSSLEGLHINPLILPNLLYMFLYAVYYVNIDCRGYFEEDGRSEGTYQLAKVLMIDEKFIDNFVRKDSWLGNVEIMNKGISYGVRRIHKTLIQNTARALLNEIYKNYNVVVEEAVKNSRLFVETAMKYTYMATGDKRIALPYI